MKKSILAFCIASLVSAPASAANCPAEWTEISDDEYKIVNDNDACGADWTEVDDATLMPFLPAGTDANGTYPETICPIQ